jgi:hypothetical protein
MLMDLSRSGLVKQGYSDLDAARILNTFINNTLACKDMQNMRVTVWRNANGVIQDVKRRAMK